MKSSRRIALSLGLATLFGAGLLFSFSIASGQPLPVPGPPTGLAPAPGAVPASGIPGSRAGVPGSAPLGSSLSTGAAAFATTGTAPSTTSPVLKQTIGISPTQPVRQQAFNVFGVAGTGGESYDLQSQNVYALLEQRGVPVRNVLYPTSTAKPSFIVERLIVLSLSGGSNNASGGSATGSASPSAGGLDRSGGQTPGAGTTQTKGPSDAERTVSAVGRVVDAEISRGSGRSGGDHRRKLQYLSRAIHRIEEASQIGGAVATAIGGAGAGQGSASGGGTKADPRELFYSSARRYARLADQLAPKGF